MVPRYERNDRRRSERINHIIGITRLFLVWKYKIKIKGWYPNHAVTNADLIWKLLLKTLGRCPLPHHQYEENRETTSKTAFIV